MEEKQITLIAHYPDDVMVHQFVTIKKYLKGKDYVRVFTHAFSIMSKDRELNLTDFRVFMGLFVHVDYENLIDISQAVLSEELAIAQQDISKSLKKLVSKGYIEVFGQRGRQNVYKLNPYVGFKGRAKNVAFQQESAMPVGLSVRG